MDRPPFYSGQIWRSFDVGNIGKDAMKGIARACQALLGNANTVVSDFSASQSTIADMNVHLTEGQIYALAQVDATTLGSLAAESTLVVQQGYAAAQAVLLSVSGLGAGQDKWALIQCEFEQADDIRDGDPTDGVIAFFDSSNPTVPLQGPDGLGGTLNTVRLGKANVDVIYGTAATAGTAVPPSATTGWAPMYLVLLHDVTTTISNGDILLAGPAAYAGYPDAPFLAGLTESHHSGTAGQAPKIKLNAEVQGILGLANLPASDTVGVLPTLRDGTTNPNGTVAGQIHDFYFQSNANTLFICTASGSSSTAVWVNFGGFPQPVLQAVSFPYTAASQNAVFRVTMTVNGVFELPDASQPGDIVISRVDVTDAILTLTPLTGQAIGNNAVNATVPLLGGNNIRLIADTSTSTWIYCGG